MRLIVTDMDGTLLNSKREISAENVAALLAAQDKGVEIAIATGRNYGNALALCEGVGLRPHIISNHGAFVYTKDGEKILGVGVDKKDIRYALTWLCKNNYFYTISTDTHSFIPLGSETILSNEFKTAKNLIPQVTEERAQHAIKYLCQPRAGGTRVTGMEDILGRDLTFGSIVSITFDQDKLEAGREYFKNYQGLSMTVAGNDIFEMIHTSVSKGNALEDLTRYLDIPMSDVMAIGDNYNDISMLKKVGISVAIGNAEEDVKEICKYVSISNDLNGVAYIINQMLNS
ncbi:Cof-type HAD-IIB family hydrolase [Pelosinus sp. sgz500959]|uniref:Cof-type HAD-IIB family hydrolase n=1 Tax=Pelosinus sp. sgz500959 TaxID=3242472 RepID=UPI00366FFD43